MKGVGWVVTGCLSGVTWSTLREGHWAGRVPLRPAFWATEKKVRRDRLEAPSTGPDSRFRLRSRDTRLVTVNRGEGMVPDNWF
jgi:hypothetical protein